jgi:hypothetical protein
LVYKRDGWAPHLGKIFQHLEALQLHFTFTRDLGLHLSLANL